MKNVSIIGTETDTNHEINDTFVKNKTCYTACLKKCNETEDLRTLHLKAGMKPDGQKGVHICKGHLQISSSFAAGEGGVQC